MTTIDTIQKAKEISIANFCKVILYSGFDGILDWDYAENYSDDMGVIFRIYDSGVEVPIDGVKEG